MWLPPLVFIAGEATNLDVNASLQGAMATGLRAAREVLEQSALPRRGAAAVATADLSSVSLFLKPSKMKKMLGPLKAAAAAIGVDITPAPASGVCADDLVLHKCTDERLSPAGTPEWNRFLALKRLQLLQLQPVPSAHIQ
jgi:hypothetical protein